MSNLSQRSNSPWRASWYEESILVKIIMDLLSNLLTSIRNAELAGHSRLVVPFSKISAAVLDILKKEGYILDWSQTETDAKPTLEVSLPMPVARHNYKRVSTSGRRLYIKSDKIPRVLRGLGIVILSTSKGVMTGKDARKLGLGGEVICEVY